MESMTPLERAARAIADDLRRQEPKHGGTYFVDATNINATVVDGTFDLRSIARAVLEAIREPSEVMVREGCLADIPGGRYGEATFTEAQIGKDDAPVIWEAMIHAALVEG